MSNDVWGVRFSRDPDSLLQDINVSIEVDQLLFRQDIAESKAHAAMLTQQGIISPEDGRQIAHGLDTILSEIECGKFQFKRALEDIHMKVEGRLSELIGAPGGRLHMRRPAIHQ